MMNLNMYLAGRLTPASQTYDVRTPASGEVVGRIAWAGKEDAESALASAAAAAQQWGQTPIAERAAWMLKLRERIRANEERLRLAIHLEMGKPWAATEEDVTSISDSLAFYAEEISRFRAEALIDREDTHDHLIVHEPVGVVVAFVAWNFPLLNLGFKLGPAMAAGCPIIIKPSFKAPLSAYIVGELCAEIGLPGGAVNIICGDDEIVGDTLSSSTIPALLTLIGSARTGRRIMEKGASSIKRYSMELGGNAPAIIFADADLEVAANTVCALKFGNSGQICVAPNRVFVAREVFDRFEAAVVARANAIKVGHDKDGLVDMGPLVDKQARDRVAGLVSSAVMAGAEVVAGGDRPMGLDSGSYYSPTVLTGVTPEMAIYREEIFGPVVSLIPFDDEGDVLRAANDTDAGLTAYLFTRDADCIATFSRRLRFGEIQVNGVKYAIDLPHGGIGQSGIGHDCSYLALHDYLFPKRITRAKAKTSH